MIKNFLFKATIDKIMMNEDIYVSPLDHVYDLVYDLVRDHALNYVQSSIDNRYYLAVYHE